MLANNQRISITIDPWAIKGTDGSELADSYVGTWHTELTPVYSHIHQIEALGGRFLADAPAMLIWIAIYDASRYVDNIAVATCPNPNLDYFCQIRNRYVTLRALLSLFDGYLGPSLVSRKVLGDFEIEFDHRNSDANVISRYLDELDKLEPVIATKGCLGIGAGHGMLGVTKGAHDPYRPIISRTGDTPYHGESHQYYGNISPYYRDYASRHANRHLKGGSRYFPRRGRR